jgi:hypothetical protein
MAAANAVEQFHDYHASRGLEPMSLTTMQTMRLVAIGTILLSTMIGGVLTSKKMKGTGLNASVNPDSFDGKTLEGSSANICGTEYGGILKFQVSDTQLMVSSSFPPRFATLLSLSKLRGVCKRSLFFKYVYMTYDDDASFKMRISKSLGDQIQTCSCGRWRYTPNTSRGS